MNGRTHRGILILLLTAAAAFLCAFTAVAQAQQANQRLILKDGSFQSVVKFEVQGDRVHYLSAERYEYEDIPYLLVNWDATKKYNEELGANKLKSHVIETPEEKEAREKEENNSVEIAPGLTLPGAGGVFLLDEFKGKAEAAEIVQNGSESSKDVRKGTLRNTINPFSTKQGLEIKGAHAQIQSHISRPTVFIDIDEGPVSNATLDARFRLIRVAAKGDTRVIGSAKVTVSGSVTEQANYLPAKVEKLGTGQWIKLTPAQNLPPGEYAVVEMLSPQEMNLYVWDFGVNPNAPANPNVWRPVDTK